MSEEFCGGVEAGALLGEKTCGDVAVVVRSPVLALFFGCFFGLVVPVLEFAPVLRESVRINGVAVRLEANQVVEFRVLCFRSRALLLQQVLTDVLWQRNRPALTCLSPRDNTEGAVVVGELLADDDARVVFLRKLSDAIPLKSQDFSSS